MSTKTLKIYTDGGARGNPGPSAGAFIAFLDDQKIKEGSQYLGKTTNNVAEYSAVILALDWLIAETDKFSNQIEFYIDSQLVVRQINGEYKIKNERLKNMNELIKNRLRKINLPVKFIHIKREENRRADLLVNKELDENMR